VNDHRNWIDRAIGYVAPQQELQRIRARFAIQAYYDAAQISRRTLGWKRPTGDPNAGLSSLSLSRLRDSTRNLVRNNGYASNALQVIVDDTVGWGITPMEQNETFSAWAGSTDIDADGRCDLTGIEHLVMRAVAQDGEALVRRRRRRPDDGLPIPLQVQVLEADYIDTGQHRPLPNGGRIVRGIEFDAIGRRAAYWLFRDHPGSTSVTGNVRFGQSVPVPASEILHVYRAERAGQVRGAPWFAPILLRIHDFDEYADATLMKQKIAACLAVITSDVTGTADALGTEDADDETIDLLQPGWIGNVPPGRTVDIVNPPSVREYSDYVNVTLHEIASGIGVTSEDMTGDYVGINFSQARMSRLRHWARVEGWRWRMLAPQMLDPLWRWAWEAAMLAGVEMPRTTMWTAPGMPWIEPDKEGLAVLRNVRSGITTMPEELRRRGLHVETHWKEYQDHQAEMDRRGIILDTDPRKMTQSGQLHGSRSADPEAMAEVRRVMRGLTPEEIDLLVMEYTGGGNGAHA
jgi:lambda family phage portal protein